MMKQASLRPEGLSILYTRFSQSSFNDSYGPNLKTDEEQHLTKLFAAELRKKRHAINEQLKARRVNDQLFLEEQRVRRAVFEERNREVIEIMEELQRLESASQKSQQKLQSLRALQSTPDLKALMSHNNPSRRRTEESFTTSQHLSTIAKADDAKRRTSSSLTHSRASPKDHIASTRNDSNKPPVQRLEGKKSMPRKFDMLPESVRVM